tara:strand:+ start:67 stop:255 length:189 start_codon:yes stop_codon:yes gene_type:complete
MTPRHAKARCQPGSHETADDAHILDRIPTEIKRRQQRGHTAIAGALFVAAVGLVLIVRGCLQ